ncbi:ubiquitin family protein [Colletotrichum tofieldiae]|nr:ubiquitin family protein [Colletotrichum tofieldiae]GKT70135.1 ubiquitin family protein [Colletotrichum tofieldiae]GKT93177.1 ubiquitin family protein [Colletotrichum tofieldiae]
MPFVIIVFENRRRLIALPDSYQSLIDKARAFFNLSGSNADLIVYFTPPFLDQEVELDPTAFDAVTDKCFLRLEETPSHTCKDAVDEPARKRPKRDRAKISLSSSKFILFVRMPFSAMTVVELKEAIAHEGGFIVEHQRLIFQGKMLEDDKSLSHYSIKDCDVVHSVSKLRGGKPAIYLMSPTTLKDVSVHVTLSHHWEITTTYPLIEKPTDELHAASWRVSVRPDGILSDFTTGIECSYLFWEADALADLSCADTSREYPFNPRNPRIHLANNIVLPFADFIPYLDRALASLTLTPGMRTDFIVYWLPNFQKIRDRGLDISFAFIPQTAFEKVAKLNIDPQPMTVARVFLVFDGVARGGTMDLADVEAIDWATRIGINVAGMEDQASFRVLEWGGMEANMG